MYVEEVYCHQLYQYLLFFILFLLPLFHFSSSSFFLSFKFSFSIDPTFLNFYSSHYLFLFLSFSQNLLCIVLPLFFFFIFFWRLLSSFFKDTFHPLPIFSLSFLFLFSICFLILLAFAFPHEHPFIFKRMNELPNTPYHLYNSSAGGHLCFHPSPLPAQT